MRFADRTRHQIFIEPEGLSTFEIYPNGISTSLPFDVQLELVHSIPGFENAHVTRPGYAIEYDFFDPRDLKSSLETKAIENLFFAGQINGTTGYEEAAAQGIVAGINAGLRVRGREPWTPRREEAYIGVLIDDLDHARHDASPIACSRAARSSGLSLREDNADLRLTPVGRELGLVPDERWRQFEARREWLAKEAARLRRRRREAGRRARRRRLRGAAGARGVGLRAAAPARRRLRGRRRAAARRPVGGPWGRSTPSSSSSGRAASRSRRITRVMSSGRGSRSSGRSVRPARACRRISTTLESTGLSNELREKLARIQPSDIGQAARISGMTPAALSLLLIHVKKRRRLSA